MRFIITLILVLISRIACADQASEAFSLMNKGQYALALSKAKNSRNITAWQIIMTNAILSSKCKEVSFSDAISFITLYPNWPQISFIKNKAEKLINSKTNRRQIVQWFAKNPPQTPQGFKHYGLALNKKSLSPEDKKLIEEIWINGSFNEQEEEKFLKKYASDLSIETHIARADQALWQGRIYEAERMLNFVYPQAKKILLTRIALATKSAKAESMFHALNKKEQSDIGLLYTYLQYKKNKKVEPSDEDFRLVIASMNDKSRSDLCWALRAYHARELMDKHQYRKAYSIVSRHNCKLRSNIIQAEWLAGWLSLRFLHKPQEALQHFKILFANANGRPLSLARSTYWIARSHKALGHKEEAKIWFNKAASFGQTFYGQLAHHELGRKELTITQEQQTHPSIGPAHATDKRILATLIKYNQMHLSEPYLRSIFARSKDPIYIRHLLDTVAEKLPTHTKVELAREASFYGLCSLKYGYPAPYKKLDLPLETPLVYSIIRQESSFQKDARDPTGGYGVMQLLLSTAKESARALGIPYNQKRLLIDQVYNMRLGSEHLRSHIAYYKGSYLLGIPSYNAGRHRVDVWIKRYGDPRKMHSLYEVIDWIEKIPFATTRGYVQQVTCNLQVYRTIAGDRSLRIVDDLTKLKEKYA